MADTEASPYIDLDGLKRAVSALDRRYAGTGHVHAVADVEGLRAELDGKAPLHHAHKMEQVVGLKTALAGKADEGHAHSSLVADAIAPGTDLDALDLAEGTPALELHACADAAGVLHAPEGLTGGFALAVELLRFAAEGDWAARQVLVSSAGREWQRYLVSGEWTAWRKVYTSGDMPAPSEIGAADRVHTHAVADVTGLRAELDGKAAAVHGHTVSDVDQLQATLDAKAAAVHGHRLADVTGLSDALAAKADAAHLHAISDVTGLGASLQAKAPLEHGHDAATQTAAGFMSATDKRKLDGVADGATRVTAVSQIANDMDFVNSDQTREQTLEITADMATKTWVAGQDYQSGADVAATVAGAVSTGTADMATRTWVEQQGYQDGEQVAAAVEAGTADMATQTWVTGRGYDTAASVDSKVAAAKADLQTEIDGKADTGHTHDDRYYTESEADALLAGKADTGHVHSAATSAADGFMSASDKVKLDGIEAGANLVTAVSELTNDSDYQTLAQVTAAINTAVAATLKWQGAVDTVDDLPATSTKGYVYHVNADGGEYAWDGSQWVELGSVVEHKWESITGKPSTFTPSAHTHSQSDVTGLASALAGKSDTGHAHDDRYYTESEVDTKLGGKSDTSHTHDSRYYTESEVDTKLAGKANSSHTHAIADTTGLQAALDGKSPTGHTHTVADTTGLQSALDGKAAASHTHSQAQVEGLADALAGKAASAHTHQQADVAGLADALAGKAATGHKHSAADVTSGILPVTRGGTGASTAAGALAALGAASAGHAHAIASADAAGFMSVDDKTKLDGIAAGANRYVHPAYTARASGLYKVAVDATGHVSGATAVTKADLTALGLPSGDTTYGLATTSAAGLLRQLSGSTGQYLRGDGTWATPPNTTYGNATQSVAGLMSAADKVKLDGVATGANRYVHPSYTARASGLYKVAVDATGHVSGVAAVTKADITALGIPGAVGEDTDTTYTLTKSGSTIKLTGSDGSESSVTDSNTTYTLASFGVTATAAELNYVDGVTSSIQSQLNGKAASSHTHTIAQVTNLQSTLDGKAASSHTHNYAASPSAGGAATYAYLPRVSQDANTLPGSTRGVWQEYSSGAANLPSLHYYHVFTGQGSDAKYNTQLALGMTTNAVYYRNRNAGTWGGWTKVYTSASKPTASEIGAAASSHTHAASAITSGTLSADRLPTVPIAKGGTGATSASAARTALGITPANIGAAASSHTHAASQVTGLTASRALVSDSSGHPAVSAVTATELGYLDGVTGNVQTQLNGKAASSHSHSYLPLSGGTLTGAVTHNAKNNRYSCSGGSWINGKTATNVPIVFPTASETDGSRYDPYMWGQNADGDVWNFGAGASNQVGFFGFNADRTANSTDWSVYMNITTGRLTSTAGFTGALSGNATTASTLQTARTINGTSFNGGANITTANWGTARTLTIGSTGKSVNGSGNVSWSLSEIGAAAANHTHSGYAASSHNHAASNITSGTLSVDRLPTVSVAKGGTGATTAAQARTNLGAAASSHNHSAANITSGTLPVARGGTGVTSDDALRQKVLNFPSNEDLLAYLNS